jgi:hypothetical protein
MLRILITSLFPLHACFVCKLPQRHLRCIFDFSKLMPVTCVEFKMAAQINNQLKVKHQVFQYFMQNVLRLLAAIRKNTKYLDSTNILIFLFNQNQICSQHICFLKKLYKYQLKILFKTLFFKTHMTKKKTQNEKNETKD